MIGQRVPGVKPAKRGPKFVISAISQAEVRGALVVQRAIVNSVFQTFMERVLIADSASGGSGLAVNFAGSSRDWRRGFDHCTRRGTEKSPAAFTGSFSDCAVLVGIQEKITQSGCSKFQGIDQKC